MIFHSTHDPVKVGIGTPSLTEMLDVAGTAQVTGFKMPTGATNSYVLTSDGSGVGTWQPAVGGGASSTVAGGESDTASGDGSINIADAVYIINYIFKGGPAPEPLCIADADGDDVVNIADAVYIINFVFKGGPPPVEPCCP